MFNKNQFKDLIERTLKEFDLYSEAAVNMLLGTAAQESKFATYLKQLGNGPALGIFQMERPTFDWLKNVYGNKYPIGNFEELEFNLKQAILLCRLRYKVVPESLPAADDVEGLAAYWKKYYNTPLGKGTTAEFVNNYKNFVGV
jgi:hypothetical protein